MSRPRATKLRRQIGIVGATLLGLGSILGTGVFVSLGLATAATGPAVLIAIALAGVVALCNALSSAQLASSYPRSGGTYEYGYRYLTPTLGFTAGWMFLIAKSASAATAALGLAGYGLMAANMHEPPLQTAVALAAAGMMTILVAGGLRRSNWVNALLVAATIGSLIAFVSLGMHRAIVGSVEHMTPLFPRPGGDVVGGWQQSVMTGRHLLGATALMFVAYTGYGRIATLSEEVRQPRRTIPIAIVVTLALSVLVYVAVGFVAVASVGPDAVIEATHQKAAPLEAVAQLWEMPRLGWVMTAGAITAMGGVLLNLLLGLSRVMLAMGRRRDMPQIVARLDEEGSTPWIAVVIVGAIVMGLILIGDVRMTWSLSAFTVLIYYGITNLAAIRLPRRLRLYPAFVPWCGLVSCLGLAACVNLDAMLIGIGIILAGLLWHRIAFRRRRSVIG